MFIFLKITCIRSVIYTYHTLYQTFIRGLIFLCKISFSDKGILATCMTCVQDMKTYLKKKKKQKYLISIIPEIFRSIMKNAFHFNLKALFILKIFKSCPEFFGHVGRRLDKRAKVNFKIYDITNLVTNNSNTHFTKYLKK